MMPLDLTGVPPLIHTPMSEDQAFARCYEMWGDAARTNVAWNVVCGDGTYTRYDIGWKKDTGHNMTWSGDSWEEAFWNMERLPYPPEPGMEPASSRAIDLFRVQIGFTHWTGREDW